MQACWGNYLYIIYSIRLLYPLIILLSHTVATRMLCHFDSYLTFVIGEL